MENGYKSSGDLYREKMAHARADRFREHNAKVIEAHGHKVRDVKAAMIWLGPRIVITIVRDCCVERAKDAGNAESKKRWAAVIKGLDAAIAAMQAD